MEFMQCEELNRELILEQLKKRELFVANVENLPLEKLQEIYKGFIVPRPRRERNERQRFVASATTKQQSQDSMPMQVEKLMNRIKVVYVVGEKRPGSEEEQLLSSASAAKRLRN